MAKYCKSIRLAIDLACLLYTSVAPVVVAMALEAPALGGAHGLATLFMAVAAEFDPRHVDVRGEAALRDSIVAGSA